MPLPPMPSKRRSHFAPPPPRHDSRTKLHHMVRRHEERERPFDPERAPTWRGSARDLVANPVGPTFRGPVELYEETGGGWESAGRYANVRHAEDAIRTSGSGATFVMQPIGVHPGRPQDVVYRLNPADFAAELRELVNYYYRQLRTPKSEDQLFDEILSSFEQDDTERAMRRANRLLEAHGVEALGDVNARRGPPYLYINMGDPYLATIMWSRDENKVFVALGGWGDVWERVESDYADE